MIGVLLLLLLAPAAAAGSAEAELALDGLHATSVSREPDSGGTGGLSATELGVRLRGGVTEGRFGFDLDYWGREPVAGFYRTTPVRMVYRAEATVDLAEDRVSLGVGRFVAPSAVATVVDGARIVAAPTDALRLEVYGGKRGLLLDDAELGFGPVLPVAGASFGARQAEWAIDARGGFGGDLVALGTDTSPATDTYLAGNGQLLGWVAPTDALRVGASATVARRATYLLTSPQVAAPFELTLLSADLFQGLGWASWRPADDVRVDAEVLRQAATLHGGRPRVEPPGPELEVVDPTFTDGRLRAAIRTFGDRGWLRPDARVRLRPARVETRVGGGAELDRIPGLEGPFVRGFLWAEDVIAEGASDDAGVVDRLLWTAAGGYRRAGFEAEAGASFVERSVAPVSARSLQAAQSADLSPFAVEAQDRVFARAFVASRSWFGGADVEASVRDAEVRVLLQVGLLTERRW